MVSKYPHSFFQGKLDLKEGKSPRGSTIIDCGGKSCGGSTRAFMSEPNTEACSASKGGIVALTHALASSLGPAVRVNAITPGWIDTTPYQKSAVLAPVALCDADHAQHPVGRVGRPEAIAILFLADPTTS